MTSLNQGKAFITNKSVLLFVNWPKGERKIFYAKPFEMGNLLLCLQLPLFA